jgi:hypothetical protein
MLGFGGCGESSEWGGPKVIEQFGDFGDPSHIGPVQPTVCVHANVDEPGVAEQF